jgi:hypothetical protein
MATVKISRSVSPSDTVEKRAHFRRVYNTLDKLSETNPEVTRKLYFKKLGAYSKMLKRFLKGKISLRELQACEEYRTLQELNALCAVRMNSVAQIKEVLTHRVSKKQTTIAQDAVLNVRHIARVCKSFNPGPQMSRLRTEYGLLVFTDYRGVPSVALSIPRNKWKTDWKASTWKKFFAYLAEHCPDNALKLKADMIA